MDRDARTQEDAVEIQKISSRLDLAAHLDLSKRALDDLVTRGIVPKASTLDQGRVAYIRYLRGRAAGWVSEDGLDLTSERARLAKEQADKLARENALARGEIVPASEVEGWLVRLFSAVMQRIRALPAKAAPEAHGTETIAACEAVLKRHTDEALEELAAARWVAAVPEPSAAASDEDRAGGVSTA